jgi:amidohydrolase
VRSAGTALKERLREAVVADERKLVELSHRIHDHPELGFEEERSSAWCADLLAEGGLDVEMGACDLPTAFVASAGSGDLVVAICAEYDALPEIGHACGHNVIAATAVGAGRALAPLADDLGLTVRVLGTPSEEGGGGKILMLERGGFDGVNAALMVHPAPLELDRMPCLAVDNYDITYRGKEAHASAYPHEGVNAADALTVAQVAIGLLRQQSEAGDQVHGIVTLGGVAPNIIPAHVTANYYIRARDLDRLKAWSEQVKACFEAGSVATGATLEVAMRGPTYSQFVTDEEMAAVYVENAVSLGRAFASSERRMSASTDMANVSLVIPSIHPLLGIDSLPAVNHQPEFAAAAVAAEADRAVVDGAAAMAWTICDLASRQAERTRLTASAYSHSASD